MNTEISSDEILVIVASWFWKSETYFLIEIEAQCRKKYFIILLLSEVGASKRNINLEQPKLTRIVKKTKDISHILRIFQLNKIREELKFLEMKIAGDQTSNRKQNFRMNLKMFS